MDQYALFGRNIQNSLSPEINQKLANSINIKIKYQIIEADTDSFYQELIDFFGNGGKGANITTPFKKMAYKACDFLTKEAEMCKVVNAVVMQKDGKFFGDNTDYKALEEDFTERSIEIKKKNIMIIGYGATAETLINLMHTKKAKKIVINGRNIEKAKTRLEHLDEKIEYFENDLIDIKYDLVINAIPKTATQNYLNKVKISDNAICYDLNYIDKEDSFTKWVGQQATKKYYSGLTMLIKQAAYSWELWANQKPNINLSNLKAQNIKYLGIHKQ